MFLLVLDELPVELVSQGVNRCVHVFRLGVGKNVCSGYVHVSLRLLYQFLHDQRDLRVGDVIEMALQPLELGIDVLAKSWSGLMFPLGIVRLV